MERKVVETLLDDLAHLLKAKDGKDLPDSQRAVLYACLSTANLSYKKMPDQLAADGYGHYRWTTLKNDGYTVFGRLSSTFGEDIKKKNCRRKLLDWYDKRQKPVSPSVSPTAIRSVSKSFSAAATSQVPGNLLKFAGWENDLAMLSQAIMNGQRLVCIRGAARIGKTYFTHALVDCIRGGFDQVIWCEAPDFPTISSLYQYLSSQTDLEPSFPQNLDDSSSIPALLELLQTHQILLVVDQTEALYRARQFAGQFQQDSKGYEHWLKRLLGLPTFRGCLIWIGREAPACFDTQYSILAWHQVSTLHTDDATKLLNRRGFSTEAIAGWEQLVTFCGGNPAWILMEAALVQRSQTTDMHQFLADPPLHPNAITILQQVFNSLSKAELIVLGWLMSIPLSYQQVRHLDSPDVLPSELENTLTSLTRRCLVRLNGSQQYCIVSPLVEHVLAEHLVGQITDELSNDVLDTLRQYPLWHGDASAERQQWQQQNRLKKIATRFQLQHGFQREQLDKLKTLLICIRELPLAQRGYAVGNILNLAITLNLHLAQLDFSNLAIRHVDLRQARLNKANFERCSFQHTLLPLNVTGTLVADMTADGMAIAIGDEAGSLFYWQHVDKALRLQGFQQFPNPIDDILFQDDQTLIFISNQTVYRWWTDDAQSPPEVLAELPAPASVLTGNNLGHIAIGLTNGQVVMWWNHFSDQPQIFPAHKTQVHHLAFSPDGRSLVSIGMDNQGVIWDVNFASSVNIGAVNAGSGNAGSGNAGSGNDIDRTLPPYQELPSTMNQCLATSWDGDALLKAGVGQSRIWLRIGLGEVWTLQEHMFDNHALIALCFSRNGHYLSGCAPEREHSSLIFCWQWKDNILQTLQHPYSYPELLAVCDKGDRLLIKSQASLVQLIDINQEKLLWQVEAYGLECGAINLAEVQGLSPAEVEMLRSFSK